MRPRQSQCGEQAGFQRNVALLLYLPVTDTDTIKQTHVCYRQI